MKAEITCSRCDIRVSAENQICPFCKKPLFPSLEEEPHLDKEIRKILVPQKSFSSIKEFYLLHGKWLIPALIALLAVFVLWMGFLLLMGLSIEIPNDPVFPIKVETVRDGGRVVLLKGTVTNHGEDIRGISLRSLGVTAEFRFSDGRVEKKRVYPTSISRGDGSLFHDESGVFEIEVPPKAGAVTLHAEIINLGDDRSFRLPMDHTDPPPKKKR